MYTKNKSTTISYPLLAMLMCSAICLSVHKTQHSNNQQHKQALPSTFSYPELQAKQKQLCGTTSRGNYIRIRNGLKNNKLIYKGDYTDSGSKIEDGVKELNMNDQAVYKYAKSGLWSGSNGM